MSFRNFFWSAHPLSSKPILRQGPWFWNCLNPSRCGWTFSYNFPWNSKKPFPKPSETQKKSSPCWSGQSRPYEKIETRRLRSKIFASTLNSIQKVVINKLTNRLIRIQYIMNYITIQLWVYYSYNQSNRNAISTMHFNSDLTAMDWNHSSNLSVFFFTKMLLVLFASNFNLFLCFVLAEGNWKIITAVHRSAVQFIRVLHFWNAASWECEQVLRIPATFASGVAFCLGMERGRGEGIHWWLKRCHHPFIFINCSSKCKRTSNHLHKFHQIWPPPSAAQQRISNCVPGQRMAVPPKAHLQWPVGSGCHCSNIRRSEPQRILQPLLRRLNPASQSLKASYKDPMEKCQHIQ